MQKIKIPLAASTPWRGRSPLASVQGERCEKCISSAHHWGIGKSKAKLTAFRTWVPPACKELCTNSHRASVQHVRKLRPARRCASKPRHGNPTCMLKTIRRTPVQVLNCLHGIQHLSKSQNIRLPSTTQTESHCQYKQRQIRTGPRPSSRLCNKAASAYWPVCRIALTTKPAVQKNYAYSSPKETRGSISGQPKDGEAFGTRSSSLLPRAASPREHQRRVEPGGGRSVNEVVPQIVHARCARRRSPLGHHLGRRPRPDESLLSLRSPLVHEGLVGEALRVLLLLRRHLLEIRLHGVEPSPHR